MIIDGKAIALDVYSQVGDDLRGAALGIVVVDPTPVIESFVRIKTRASERLGVILKRFDAGNNSTTRKVADTIASAVSEVDGLIVQLPLPAGIDVDEVLSAIPRNQDVDGLNPTIIESSRVVRAPVAEAIREILVRNEVDVRDKRCVVVGEGRLVGAPTAHLLRELGGDVATVTLEKGSLEQLCDADIAVLGAGQSHMIKPDMIKEGCLLFDAGTSEQGGQIVGDADPACAGKCALFTPVPGGIGPIAVSMIYKNLLILRNYKNNTRGITTGVLQ